MIFQAQCRPLVEASARDHERTVKLLLQYNANPDIQDMVGVLMDKCLVYISLMIKISVEWLYCFTESLQVQAIQHHSSVAGTWSQCESF